MGRQHTHTHIPTHTPVFRDFHTYRTGKIRYFRKPYLRYPRIPRYFDISIPTVPARSGIFESHTHDTHDTPVFQDFDIYRTGKIRYSRKPYLRYPRIPRYFKISIPTVPAKSGIFRCHTHDTHAYPGMAYPGKYRGTPGMVPYLRDLCKTVYGYCCAIVRAGPAGSPR